MRALIYNGPKQMALEEAPKPEISDDESLVRVKSVGICGSDMHGYLGHDDRRPPPLILGHEAAGIIEKGPRTGERVTVNPLVGCGECRACNAEQDHLCPNRQLISMPPRQGGFAEYLRMPQANLVQIPDDMEFDIAALTEPMAVCWHAVKLGLEGQKFRENALVLGGGAIGVGTALSLVAAGITDITVVEPNEKRRKVVATIGDFTVVEAAPEGVLFDVVMDAVGYPATQKVACAAVQPGGTIVHIGLGGGDPDIDVRRITLQEIRFIGSYCYSPADFRETLQMIGDGKFGALDWFHVADLSEGPDMFSGILAGEIAAPKVILRP